MNTLAIREGAFLTVALDDRTKRMIEVIILIACSIWIYRATTATVLTETLVAYAFARLVSKS